MRAERIKELDIAKGICILLMVIGHSGMPDALHRFIYAFHMPFFFFVSGITTNVSKSLFPYLQNKIKGLLVPFLIYDLIHFPSYALIYNRSAIEQFISEFNEGSFGSALWFVPILFMAHIINWLVPRKKIVEFVAILVLSSISSILCIEKIILPYNLSVLGLGASFVVMGRLLSLEGVNQMYMKFNDISKYLLIIIASMIVTWWISLHYSLNVGFCLIEPCLPIMVGALSGILMILFLSRVCFLKCRMISLFLSYSGANTFVFLGFSQFILKFENLYIRDLVALKYLLLFASLYTIIWLKNQIPMAKALKL